MADPRAILDNLRGSGYSAYFVGGCVRDQLLGLPVKDFDIATSATPPEVLEVYPHAKLVGANFGVVMVGSVEVATYRSEGSYRDGRRPDMVQFEIDPAEDARRRDFTVNALFLDPVSGKVLDFVGGRADLEARIIRAIGDPFERFREDRLRMLRAVRLAARLGFTIESKTTDAIRALAPEVQQLAPERVRDELTRMLTEGHARPAFELLDQLSLLRELLPEVAAFRGVEQPPEFHPEGDVWTHVMMMLAGLGQAAPALAWGVLLHDVGKPGTFAVADRIRFNGHVALGVEIAQKIMRRLRFSNEDASQVIALIQNHMRFADIRKMKDSTLKRFLRMEKFDEHMELHRLDCLSSHGWLDNYQFAKDALTNMPPEVIRPPKLLTGDDLITAGWRPGPAFGRVLAEIEDAQLEGRITSKEEALALAAMLRSQSSE